MHGAAGFLDSFIQDEIDCRCLTEEDFGAPLANEKADVPLQDMYNRGLVLPQQGRERLNLGEDNHEWKEISQSRPGMTGYIPSMEEALEQYPASSPRPQKLILALGSPATKRGLSR
jgi:hypothetical protein